MITVVQHDVRLANSHFHHTSTLMGVQTTAKFVEKTRTVGKITFRRQLISFPFNQPNPLKAIIKRK